MCIIVFKDHGAEKPTKDLLETCWDNNPHGAGLAILRKNHIDIEKGFMTFEDFWQYSNEVVNDSDAVAYHMRIATSGGINKGMTHPFPVTSNVSKLKATSIKAPRAFIHNGVISKGSAELSDTAMYVRDTLSHYDVKDIQTKVPDDTAGSRTITMDAKTQKAYMSGKWITDDKTGLMFSNESYIPYEPLPYQYFSTSRHTDYIKCPYCDCYADLISDHWGMYECENCHDIFDYKGNPFF